MIATVRRSCRSIILLAALCGATTGLAEEPRSAEPKMCAAVRGNGGKVFVHFASLARMHEHYGMLWGISGGSSGSVVSFFTDSMYANPLLRDCGEKECSRDETSARVALLMKSFQAQFSALSAYPESQAFFEPALVAAALEKQKISEQLDEKPAEGLKAFKDILESEAFKPYVNPEIVSTLDQSPLPVALAKDIATGIKSATNFGIDSETVFLRPGVTYFKIFADYFGRLASFYAADGAFVDKPRYRAFFEACATPGRGREWSAVAKLPAGSSTCGGLFASLLQDYYKAAKSPENLPSSRAEKPIGSSLHVLTSVTQIGGQTAKMWAKARQDYVSGKPVTWAPDFKDWTVGYMGRDEDLDRLVQNNGGYSDLKTLRASPLRGMVWRDILEHSPAEPGTSRALEIKGRTVTTGGWSDGQPVQALKNIGCEKVVLYETQPAFSYQTRVASLLGATSAETDSMFSSDDKTSSLAVAFNEADGVWCTNWYTLTGNDMAAMTAMGWNGDFEVRSDVFTQAGSAYPNVKTGYGKTVCTAKIAR